METTNVNNMKGRTRVQWAVAILVNLTVLTYGLQCGWVSPMTIILQSTRSPVGRPLTDSEISLVAGITSLAAMAAIPALTYIVDRFGRKCTLIVMCFFQFICWVIKICPASLASLLVARAFCGFGAAGCFVIVPMYIKEISQDNIRGILGSIFALYQNLGILAMYALGAYLDYYLVLYIVVGVPLITAVVMLITSPESPDFLVKKGKIKEAAMVIARLRGLDVNNKFVEAEIDRIKREDEYFKSIPNISFFKIFKERAWRRGFIIMAVLIVIHSCNGAFAIIIFAATLLADSNIEISPALQTLGVPIFMTFGIAITMCSVDRIGRKLLLGGAFITSALAFFGLGSMVLLRDYADWSPSGWWSVIGLLIIVCCYGGAINPIPCVIISEIFNFQIRAKLMGLLSFLAWFPIFIQLISFTALTNSFGAHTAFYTFGVLNLVGAAVLVIFLPETKGKTVEQIESELRKEKGVENRNIRC